MPYIQFLRLILIFILISIVKTSCDCLNNGTCNDSGNFCLCPQNYIGTQCQFLAYNITQKSANTEISSQSYTYFYYQPTQVNIFIMKLQLCIQKNTSIKSNLIFVEMEDFDGKFKPNGTRLNEISGQQGCNNYKLEFIPFRKKSSDIMTKVIIGMKLNGNTNQKQLVTLTAQCDYFLTEAFWLALIIIFVSAIIIFIIALIGFLIKSRCFPSRNRNQTEFNISHFDKQLPVVKYQSLLGQKSSKSTIQGSYQCAICLTELEPDSKIRKTPCQHIYHQECLDSWCVNNISCPVCRTNLELQSIQQFRKNSINLNEKLNKTLSQALL